MRTPNLEAAVPGFKAARDRERLHRALAFADVPWTICGLTCAHLTPGHRVELQLAGNALACGLLPKKGDVFQILWRLNPAFSRKIGFRGWLAKRRVVRAVRMAQESAAALEVLEYMTAMMQDLPESSESADSSNPAGNYVHWMAGEAAFFMSRFNMAFREYRETPYLILQQLHRGYRLSHELDPQFINASDRLINQWQRHHAQQIANRAL